MEIQPSTLLSPIEMLRIYPMTFCFQAEYFAAMEIFPIPMIRAALGKTMLKMDKNGELPVLDGIPMSDYLFSNQMASSHPWHKEYQDPPRGFWLSIPPTSKTTYQPGEIMIIKCTLCGVYSGFAEALVNVFYEAGLQGFGNKKAAFSLVSVSCESAYGKQSIVWKASNPGEMIPMQGISILDHQNSFLTGNTLKINFKSPTALNKSHNIYGGIPFMELVELLAKRLTLLSNMYCNSVFHWEKQYDRTEIRNVYVSESKLKWEIYTRISNRQGSTAPVEGYEGHVVYITGKQENLQQYLPLLLLGQHSHIGRNIAFGGGKYEIDHGCYQII